MFLRVSRGVDGHTGDAYEVWAALGLAFLLLHVRRLKVHWFWWFVHVYWGGVVFRHWVLYDA